MKTRTFAILSFFSVALLLTVLQLRSSNDNSSGESLLKAQTVLPTAGKTLFNGRIIEIGANYGSYICGDDYICFVASATDVIDIGTYVYGNKNCTIPWPDGIITSMEAPTFGMTYQVSGGVIVGYASSC